MDLKVRIWQPPAQTKISNKVFPAKQYILCEMVRLHLFIPSCFHEDPAQWTELCTRTCKHLNYLRSWHNPHCLLSYHGAANVLRPAVVKEKVMPAFTKSIYYYITNIRHFCYKLVSQFNPLTGILTLMPGPHARNCVERSERKVR